MASNLYLASNPGLTTTLYKADLETGVVLDRSTGSREAIVADIWLEFGLDTILTDREAGKIILQKSH